MELRFIWTSVNKREDPKEAAPLFLNSGDATKPRRFRVRNSIDLNMGYYHIELSPRQALYYCPGASTNIRDYRWDCVTVGHFPKR
jgi:hypothetical protein